MSVDVEGNASAPVSVSDAIAKVLMSDFTLQVDREDAAFICGIHAHMEISRRPSLEEDELERIFDAVSAASMTDSAGVKQRAAMAVQRLRKQGLIERADARGLASSGVYTLSSLAVKLRDEIFERESLTRRSLRVMLKRLIGDLAIIKRAAEQGGDRDVEYWNENVVDQLRHLVQEVIRSIARRQKGLEAEQLDIRRKIVELIKADGWQESKSICDQLLHTTSSTLEELHKMLMQEMGAVENLLLEIAQSAQEFDQGESWEMADRLRDQVDGIRRWSENFQATWQEYYKKTHEHTRFNLRVDPNRKLSQRLRQSIKDYADHPWHLRAFSGERCRQFREDDTLPESKSLAKVKVTPQREAEDTSGQKALLCESIVEAARQVLERDGELRLSDFLAPYKSTLSDEELLLVAGTLQAWLMRHADPSPMRESEWISLRGSMEIQDVKALVMSRKKVYQSLG